MTIPARPAALVAAMLAVLAPHPAHADFYSLAGRFQCLEKPGAVCYDATPTQAVPHPKPAATAIAAPAPLAAPPIVATPLPAPARRPTDAILAIAERIKAWRPAPGDLARLRIAAAAGDPRAIELLAWCELKGIGTSRDPIAAYFLYGAAAAASVPHARANQAAIYEAVLTPHQRESVLLQKAMPRTPRPMQVSERQFDGAVRDLP